MEVSKHKYTSDNLLSNQYYLIDLNEIFCLSLIGFTDGKRDTSLDCVKTWKEIKQIK
jgi:hypothetical protein